MEKNLELISLFEVYGKMLTKHMQDIFTQYYYSDLSLREIAANNNISYQAVNDSIKKTQKLLLEYEDKIKALEMKKDILCLIENSKNLQEIEEIARKYR